MQLPTFPTALLLLSSLASARSAKNVRQPCDEVPVDGPLDVRSELFKHGVIPDVVDDFYPSIILDVTYKSGARVHYGNWIDIDDVKSKPSVTIHPSGPILDPRVHYYLAMTDPDAPARTDPRFSEVCHWLLTNVTQTCHCDCKEGSRPRITSIGPGIDITGDDLVSYFAPSPQENTGPHRYVFVLLRPKDPAADPALSKPARRRRWGNDGKEHYGVREYAEKHGLEPVGANVHYVENRKGAPGYEL